MATSTSSEKLNVKRNDANDLYVHAQCKCLREGGGAGHYDHRLAAYLDANYLCREEEAQLLKHVPPARECHDPSQ